MASRALTPKQTPKWFVGKDPLGDGLVANSVGDDGERTALLTVSRRRPLWRSVSILLKRKA